jgi:hypothetical protein
VALTPCKQSLAEWQYSPAYSGFTHAAPAGANEHDGGLTREVRADWMSLAIPTPYPRVFDLNIPSVLRFKIEITFPGSRCHAG